MYRGGEYCTGDRNSAVQFGLQGEKDPSKWKPGNAPQTVSTNDEGRLLVNMDLGKFKTADNQKEVQAGEALYYLFQLEYGDGSSAEYYPIMLRVDTSMNLDDIAATGDSIVAWEKNESGQKQPYIAQQTVKYSQSATANVGDIRKSTGQCGPQYHLPHRLCHHLSHVVGRRARQGPGAGQLRDAPGCHRQDPGMSDQRDDHISLHGSGLH